MRRFFVEKDRIRNDTACIIGSDARHIKSVLRLKPGDAIALFDSDGAAYEARISTLSAERVEAAVTRRYAGTAESRVQITLAQGFLKERKMDGLVRQLTELGICRWVPFMAERSIPRPDADRMRSRKNRWEKIAREAVKQCRRGRIPEIGSLLSFDDMLARGRTCDLKVVFWEGESEPLRRTRWQDAGGMPSSAWIVLGPEGGLTAREVAAARKQGFVTAALGPRILRADTATVAACTVVQSLFGDMG